MGGGLSVLVKDGREHGLALFSLATGLIVMVLLLLARQRAGEFNLSSFEVVRFALISVIPLITFIVGNRLVVREYSAGTRLFVESLPLNVTTPLIVKYLTGWCYLLVLGTVLIALSAALAGSAEFIDSRYLLLLLLRTSAIITLYWSIVFFASLTGKLRLLIYLIVGLALITLINHPGLEASRLGPVALMDQQLFVFERITIPWHDLIETLGFSLGFVVSGFGLALINEGSAIEQLGKPLSKRNMTAVTLLGLVVLSIYAEHQQERNTKAYEFTGEQVLRGQIIPIEISFIDEKYRPIATRIRTSLTQILIQLQADAGLGLATLPKLQIALNDKLERSEVYPEYTAGVLVTANFANYNDYEHSMLYTVGLHHLLLSLTNSRWSFETRHWMLDGLAHWWAEGAANAPASANNPEHFARAILTLRRIDSATNPMVPWQSIIDQYGFEAAGTLGYTALLYLAERQGVDTVISLASHYINEKPGSSSLETVKRLFNSDADRFEEVTGLTFSQFVDDWREWLSSHENDPAINKLLASVPTIAGDVQGIADARGVYWLEADYTALPGYVDRISGSCVLRHQLTGAYDVEEAMQSRERDRQKCTVGKSVHRVESRYTRGDRTYVVLEFENDQFSRPIILWAGRVHFQ